MNKNKRSNRAVTKRKETRGRFSVLQHPTDSINYWEKRDQPVKTLLLYYGGFDYE